MQEGYYELKGHCRQSVILMLGKGQMSSERARRLSKLAALGLYIYLLGLFFEQ